MTSDDFEYVAAKSLDDAIAALAGANGNARVLAGGQSLLPELRRQSPKLIVDIGAIAALRGISADASGIVIGSMVTYEAVLRSRLVNQHAHLLRDAVAVIADPQVRYRGTVGGALAHAHPAGDVGAAMLTLDAEIVIMGKGAIVRTVSARDFFVGGFQTTLREGELLTQIRIPPADGWNAHYEKFVRVGHQWAIVGVAAMVRIEGGAIAEARVGLTNMGPIPLRATSVERALVGRPPTSEVLQVASALASADTDPPSDVNGDATYRRHIAKVLTYRAVRSAVLSMSTRGTVSPEDKLREASGHRYGPDLSTK